MASLESVFAVVLEDRISSPAAKAKASLSGLSAGLKNAKTQLAGYQAQLGLAKELGDAGGIQKYSALVQGAQRSVFDLGQKAEGAAGGLGEAGATAGLTSGSFTILSYAAKGAAAAIGAVVAITSALVYKSLEVVNTNQLMVAQFEAMGEGPGAGAKTLDMLDGLSKRLPQSREQLAQWTRQIEKMGVTDLSKIRSELVATASAQAILGEGGAEAYEKISRKVNDAVEGHHALKVSSKELTRTIGTGLTADVAQRMGLSLGDLEAKLKNGTVDAQKFGDELNAALTSKGKGPLDVMMNSLGVMAKKGYEALSHLFDGIDTKPLTDALRSVIELGDQGKPSGQTLKKGITAGMNGIIAALGRGITNAEIFFLKIEIMGLKAYIVLKPLIKAVHEISSVMGAIGAIDAKRTGALGANDKSMGAKQGTSEKLAGLVSINPFTQLKAVFDLTIGSLADAKAQEVARAQGVAVGASVEAGMKDGLGVHSPSLAAIRIGMQVGEGLGMGMEASPAPARAARTISGNALGGIGAKGIGGAANDTGSKGPTSNVFHINITAPDGVTDAHAISVVGLATALERYQIGERAMSAPSPTVDPIKNSTLWFSFVLKGVASPGSIPKGGMKGFARKTGWDEKKGKGTQGATLTLTSAPPCKGSFTLQLFTVQDFADWDTFVSTVLSIDPKQQQSEGLNIYYPALSSIGLTTVVVESYTAPEHQGKGLYHVEIHLIEWVSPPAVSIVSTPNKTAGDTSNPPTTPTPPNPELERYQKELGLLQPVADAP